MTNYRVGDRDTTREERGVNAHCGADHADGYICTRISGHSGQHVAGNGLSISEVWGDLDPTEGVWAIVYRDYYELIEKVYPTEIEALRAINGAGQGTVKFLPWGKALNEIEEES